MNKEYLPELEVDATAIGGFRSTWTIFSEDGSFVHIRVPSAIKTTGEYFPASYLKDEIQKIRVTMNETCLNDSFYSIVQRPKN